MALHIADRVVKALHGPIALQGIDHEITVSVGMTYQSVKTLGGRTDITAAHILAEADAAMYQAKNLGKDRFEVFSDGRGQPGRPLPVT